jgi:phosphatidylglycerophosphate synthase
LTYSYEKTLKTKPDDTFLNLQSFLYIGAKQITKLLYYTPVSPHQVIFISMVFGLAAAYLIIQNNFILVLIGSILLFYKNVLDKVDGSLARVKGLDSRRGRFYDSISDFIVTFATFAAMSYKLFVAYHSIWIFVLGFAAMICSMLQCSYFIFYQVSFIMRSGKKPVNRLIESVTEEDIRTEDKWTLFLQKIFMIIYGWQDKLFASLDNYFRKKLVLSSQNLKSEISNLKSPVSDRKSQIDGFWYSNKPFLTAASSLSIGTHIFFICIFAVIGRFELYFFVNLILWNLLLICLIIYHYISAKKKIKAI